MILGLSVHVAPQTEGPHVRPDFIDVFQTLRFFARFASHPPALRDFPAVKPDRVLLLVIDDHVVNTQVLVIVERSHHHLEFFVSRVWLPRPAQLLLSRFPLQRNAAESEWKAPIALRPWSRDTR